MVQKKSHIHKASFSNEYYWFSRHFITCSLLLFLFVWTLLPRDTDLLFIKKTFVNEVLSILPNRYWVICFECTVLMGMLWTYTALLMYNEDVLTPNLDELRTITDEQSVLAIEDKYSSFIDKYAFKETSGVVDLPISDVCTILYGDDTM